MEIIADLHLHSKHSRATSKNLSIDNLEKFGRIKGINLLGTGDFQHKEHRKELNDKLTEDDKGILYTDNNFAFLWQTEISLMFSEHGKRRAVHLVVFSPNTDTTDKITSYLSSKGRIDYDGRPIFGITCRNFTADLKNISDKIEIIPAHCMTPWFGLFGSKSGFDTLQECFGDQTNNIYAVESGMSADPKMLWRFKENANIVSFSDAHSFWPWRIGREATIFDIPELTYNNIIKAIRTKQGLSETIETPPAYGKYHWDGHRNCNFSCAPKETKRLQGICPKCNKTLTIGVDYRVEELAKEQEGYKPKDAIQFYTLVPLHELIAFIHNTTLASQKSWQIYNNLIDAFGNELNILLKTEKEKLARVADDKLTQAILKNREAKIKINPGYDGEYGKVMLGEEKQKKLF